eukprot:Clim_evm17s159 gene=Clim_evmTU17s159
MNREDTGLLELVSSTQRALKANLRNVADIARRLESEQERIQGGRLTEEKLKEDIELLMRQGLYLKKLCDGFLEDTRKRLGGQQVKMSDLSRIASNDRVFHFLSTGYPLDLIRTGPCSVIKSQTETILDSHHPIELKGQGDVELSTPNSNAESRLTPSTQVDGKTVGQAEENGLQTPIHQSSISQKRFPDLEIKDHQTLSVRGVPPSRNDLEEKENSSPAQLDLSQGCDRQNMFWIDGIDTPAMKRKVLEENERRKFAKRMRKEFDNR